MVLTQKLQTGVLPGCAESLGLKPGKTSKGNEMVTLPLRRDGRPRHLQIECRKNGNPRLLVRFLDIGYVDGYLLRSQQDVTPAYQWAIFKVCRILGLDEESQQQLLAAEPAFREHYQPILESLPAKRMIKVVHPDGRPLFLKVRPATSYRRPRIEVRLVQDDINYCRVYAITSRAELFPLYLRATAELANTVSFSVQELEQLQGAYLVFSQTYTDLLLGLPDCD